MPEAVIVDAVRSPMGRGKQGGALSSVHAVDLLAAVLTGLVERTGIDPGTVDDVMVGCVGQAGSTRPPRAGRRGCGRLPGARAVGDHRAQVRLGPAGAGVRRAEHRGRRERHRHRRGLESMSRVPMGSARMGADPHGPGVRSRFPDLVSAGRLRRTGRRQVGDPREQLDEYSARSHARAAATAAAGGFDDEIVP